MGNFEAAFAGLNAAQRQAVEHIDGPVLVIAGPGTGKTQLLTTRIAHILAKTDTLPQNILCLTFTESGAQTMRERLAGMIGQAAYDVTIGTYHAFGSELMRRFPDYFAAGDVENPVDDLGTDAIFRAIINELPYSSPLKYADNYLGDIKTLVSDAKRALLTPDDLRAVAKQNETFTAGARPVIAEALHGMARIDKKAIAQFEKILAGLQPLAAAKTAKTPANVVPLAHLFVQELATALQTVHESGEKTTTLTAWKNAWLAKDSAGEFVLDGEKVCEKLRVLALIYEKYLTALAKAKLFDYDDMILRVVHALQANADLRYTLQEQYLYVLLDEFQDTNGAQLRLVELLTDNPASEGRPNVLAVGDDDQAIYAFQGANYSHMLAFQKLYRDVLVVPLTQNYRSHGDVLKLAAHISGQIGERLHHHFPAIDKTLVAANTTLPKTATIERREAKSDAGEFAWTAAQIHELLANGMRASDIAVLAPQHKYLEPLVPFLQKLGVPVRYEKRENVLDDPAINQLIRMSELCAALSAGKHAQANALWPEILSFDFWQLPTSTIWELSWQASDARKNWTELLLADETLRPIALFFVRLSLIARDEPLENMLDFLTGSTALELHETALTTYQSPFYAYYFGGAGAAAIQTSGQTFWNVLSNLTVLRARLREHRLAQTEPLTLQDFLQFVQAHREANIKILNTSPYQEADDAVQLMTAFKAKGQEFDAVFLLAANDEAWGTRARAQTNHLRLPQNLQFIRYAGATDDERLRLLYVAVTRAKTQLFIVNYVSTFAGKHLTRLKYLDESADETGAVLSPFLPAKSQRVLPADAGQTDDIATAANLEAYWRTRHESSGENGQLSALLKSRLANFQLSPTHVNAFTDLEHAGPRTFFMDTLLRFPKAPTPQGEFGSAIHETLEWLHIFNKTRGELPDFDATRAQFVRTLTAKQLAPRDVGQLLERGETCLRAYLAQRSQTVRAENECEYNFRNEGVFVGRAHMSGKIDKLIIDRPAKTVTIVDYKTGKACARWQHDVRLHKYRQQLYLYRALVEGSHHFAGWRVTGAYLEFVEPDDDGMVRELHLDFDEQEFVRVKQLAEKVWQHVQALDFPDVGGFSPDIRGVELFEDWLLQDPA